MRRTPATVVLYVARDLEGAFAETFLRRPGATILDSDLLRRKAYIRIETRSELKLIKLTGSGLAILGATAEVVQGGLPYNVPQIWSKALEMHPANPHGIAYYGRHDDEALCYALFDRASAAMVETERTVDLDQEWFWQLAARYRIGLAP